MYLKSRENKTTNIDSRRLHRKHNENKLNSDQVKNKSRSLQRRNRLRGNRINGKTLGQVSLVVRYVKKIKTAYRRQRWTVVNRPDVDVWNRNKNKIKNKNQQTKNNFISWSYVRGQRFSFANVRYAAAKNQPKPRFVQTCSYILFFHILFAIISLFDTYLIVSISNNHHGPETESKYVGVRNWSILHRVTGVNASVEKTRPKDVAATGRGQRGIRTIRTRMALRLAPNPPPPPTVAARSSRSLGNFHWRPAVPTVAAPTGSLTVRQYVAIPVPYTYHHPPPCLEKLLQVISSKYSVHI